MALAARGAKRGTVGEVPILGDLLVSFSDSFKISMVLRQDIVDLLKRWEREVGNLTPKQGKEWGAADIVRLPTFPKKVKTKAGKPADSGYLSMASSRSPSPRRNASPIARPKPVRKR